MGIRFIYGRAGTGKSYTCVEEIYERSKDNNKPLILIVPEQLSFRAEKALIDRIGATGINNVHLLSFKRLAFTVFNEVGGITHKYMDDTGKAIIIGRSIEEVQDDLTIFKRATKQNGFVEKIIGVLTEFKRHNIFPQTLLDLKENVDENSLLVDKLTDVEKIYSKFQEKINEGYFDSEDNLTILKDKIEESEFLKGAEVWIDEFNGFTPQQYDIIGRLLKLCTNINITLPYSGREVQGDEDDTNPFYPIYVTEQKLTKVAQDYGHYPKGNLHLDYGYRFKNSKELQFLERNYFTSKESAYKGNTEDIKIFKAQNPYGEVEYIAKEILKLVRENKYRFRDIILVTRDLENYKDIVRVIFDEYEIPYFIDDKEDIASNPLIVYITSLLNIFAKGWRDNSIINYFKSGFTILKSEEVDLLENYALEFGIKSRKKWIDEDGFYFNDHERYPGITEIKEKGVTPLIKLEQRIKGKHTVRELCEEIYKFLVEGGVYEKVSEYIELFKVEKKLVLVDEYSNIWNMLIELFDQFVELLGNEVLSIEDFSNMMNMGISHNKMGLIPTSMDQIVVGSADRIKAQEVKAAMIIGVNDGLLPRTSGDEGLFNDSDRITFKNNGISVADNSLELAFGEQHLIYELLTLASGLLYVTYPIADLEGRTKRYSMVIPKLKGIFENITEETDIIYHDDIKEEDTVVAELPTFNMLVEKLHDYLVKDEISPLWQEIYRYFYSNEDYKEKLDKVISGFTYKNHVEEISRQKIRQLYGRGLSVSKIEAYANCSFGYFVRYGLRAKERKIYTFAPLDFGNLLHEGIEKFSKKVEDKGVKWGTLDDKFCEDLVKNIIDEMMASEEHRVLRSSKRYEYIGERVKRILYRMVRIINEQMERGTFQPMGYELSFGFGEEDYYPPIEIKLSSGEVVKLQGKIDRVDKTTIDGVNYYRVVDYKTGRSDLDINDVYNGLKIQLLTYLDAVLTLEERRMAKGPAIEDASGRRTKPGAMVYLAVDDPIMDGSKKITMENINEEILKALKMKGLVIKDLKIVREMDKTIEGGGTSAIIPVSLNKPKKGETEPDFGKRNNSVISNGAFNVLRDHMKEKIKEVCENMLEGIIEVTPCKNGKSSYCDFCDFSSICQFDETMGINNYRVMPRVKPAELLERLEEEGKGGESLE